MHWILDNIQFVIAFAAAIAWWLNKRRETSATQRDAKQQLPPALQPGRGASDEERARRIQEEIRRKIAERRTLPPVASPPIVLVQRTQPVAQPAMLRESARPEPEPWKAMEASIASEQRQIEDRLRAIEETSRRAAELRKKVPATGTAQIPAQASRATAGGILAALRNVADARRAIVLREILGPPKGLQP